MTRPTPAEASPGLAAGVRRRLPWIALVSNPRSGTTHAIRLMEALAGLSPCREEWLNVHGVPWVGDRMRSRLQQAHGRSYAEYHDPDLGAWTRADFARTLDFVQAACPAGTRASVVKVLFPDLAAPQFEALFLTDPRSVVLVMQRAPVDSFISLTKARAVDKWLGHDTTGLRVALDAAAFIAEWEATAAWYRDLRAVMDRTGRPYGLLDYDRDILPGEDRALARLIEELARAGIATRLRPRLALERRAQGVLATAGALVGKVPAPRPIGLPRQDRANSREAKVSNWGAFVDQVGRHPAGVRMLDSYGVWD